LFEGHAESYITAKAATQTKRSNMIVLRGCNASAAALLLLEVEEEPVAVVDDEATAIA